MKAAVLMIVIFSAISIRAQENVIVYGIVTDEENLPVELVSVVVDEFSLVVNTTEDGSFEVSIPADNSTVIQFRRTGFKAAQVSVPAISLGKRYRINITLAS